MNKISIALIVCATVLIAVPLMCLKHQPKAWLAPMIRKEKRRRTLRVLIAMWYNDAIRKYADITFRINSMYSKRHGIHLIRSSTPKSGRAFSWERVPLLLDQLSSYDYVIWCDADACFSPASPDVRELLRASSYPDAIVSEDIPTEYSMSLGTFSRALPETERSRCSLNAGIIMVKNSEAGLTLLRRWYDENAYEAYTDDQSVLRSIYMSYINGKASELGNIVKIPYGQLQTFINRSNWKAVLSKVCSARPYVYHAAGEHDMQKRISIFEDLERLTKNC